jgi:hypothetical protein
MTIQLMDVRDVEAQQTRSEVSKLQLSKLALQTPSIVGHKAGCSVLWPCATSGWSTETGRGCGTNGTFVSLFLKLKVHIMKILVRAA